MRRIDSRRRRALVATSTVLILASSPSTTAFSSNVPLRTRFSCSNNSVGRTVGASSANGDAATLQHKQTTRLCLSSGIFSGKRPRRRIGTSERYQPNDWIKNLITIPTSFVLHRIGLHILFDAGVTVSTLFAREVLGWRWLRLSETVHGLLAGFLGLLLVFRTNTAYARYDEARDVWKQASSFCRSLAHQSVINLRQTPCAAAKFEQLLLAFPDVLAYTCLAGNKRVRLPPFEWALIYGKVALDSDYDLDEQPSDEYAADEYGFPLTLNEQSLPPGTLLVHNLHTCLSKAAEERTGEDELFNLHLITMGRLVNKLCEVVSACEKIRDCPVPLTYSRHTSRFLTLYCGTLPLAIAPKLGWLSVPVMAVFSWLVYGLEEIGHVIEMPFYPVSTQPSYLMDDGAIDDDRASKTRPYDIGLPVCAMSERIRTELKKILALRPRKRARI